MFCPLCGKNTEKLIDRVCPKCFTNSIKSSINNLEIKVCKICKSVFIGNESLSKQILERKIEKFVRRNINVKSFYIDKKLKVDIDVKDILIHLNLDFQEIICKKCSYIPRKKRVLLQLRGNLNKILETLEDLADKDYNIVEVIEKREGLDIFLDESLISLRNFLRKYMKQNAKIKITRKLIGFDRQRSRKIYRLKVLLRID